MMCMRLAFAGIRLHKLHEGVFGPLSAAFYRWYGREGPIHWPSRSPDLTTLKYFLLSYIKQKIRERNPEDA